MDDYLVSKLEPSGDSPFGIYQYNGMLNYLLNDKYGYQKDSTYHALMIESSILANGFKGSFDGYYDQIAN